MLSLSQLITSGATIPPSTLKTLSRTHPLPLLFLQFKTLISTDLCTHLINSFTQSTHHLHSILVYTNMLKFSAPPDIFTFPPLLKSIASLRLPALALSAHSHIVKSGLSPDVVTSTALLHTHSALSNIEYASKVFDEMPVRNPVTWNAMITGCVHNRKFIEAHALFTEMQAEGVEIGEVTVVGALSACAHLGALNQGIWIHDYVRGGGVRTNVYVGTALTDMYMKCGEVGEAVEVFRAMRERNVISWNVLISGLAVNGSGGDAREAFDGMVEEGVRPDGVTFLAVLSACCHQGCVSEGKSLFERMEGEFGVLPRIEHYGCMVDLLARAGLLDEARELIRAMPMRPDVVVWRALLAGCRTHGNARLGEEAICKLLEMEPENGDNYAMVSNVLARDRRWSELAKVRSSMSRMGIWKMPGCSSIEIDNVVHEFVVTNRERKAEWGEIYEKLAEVSKKLKLAGYVADTEMVPYDLEEEEKESSLMYHSEKLALAFGLLRTAKGSTVRIVKNLRVCKDCHLFIKLVSLVYKRHIVVRDRNRFHHFVGGVCSCRDFW